MDSFETTGPILELRFRRKIPAYGVCISQLIRYSVASASYQDFTDGGLHMTRKLLRHGFLRERLDSSIRVIFGRHHDLIDQ